jgi:hypothetical protein
MRKNITFFAGSAAIIIIFALMMFLVIKPVLAQAVDSMSSSTPDVATSTEITADATSTDASSPPLIDTSTETTSTGDVLGAATSTPDTVAEVATSTDPLVEVPLNCQFSYMANVFDTSSGRLDEGYYLDAVPATTTGTVAHIVGQQAWTECHDKRGNVHKFQLTGDEYAALALPDAGTPQKSVMETSAQAAIDSTIAPETVTIVAVDLAGHTATSTPDTSASSTAQDDSSTATP